MSMCIWGCFFVIPVLFAAPDNPKTANYFLRWEIPDMKTANDLAEWDVLVLDMETQVRSPNMLRHIRQKNPDIIMLVYITSQEVTKDTHTQSTMRRRLLSQIPASWYLQTSTRQKLSWWQGTYLLNATNYAPAHKGIRWNTFLPQFVAQELFSTGLWDGVFYDNMWEDIVQFAGGDIDLQLDGVADNRSFVDRSWREGMTTLYTETRRLVGSQYYIVGNGLNTVYSDYVDGMMLENLSQHDWSRVMSIFRAHHDSPRSLNILNNNTSNTGEFRDYQNMRFGLTSSLLEDGYYSFDFGDQNHGQTWWYDEYNVDLGKPLSDAVSDQGHASYAPDVWRRNFENGLSLVNSTDRARRVDLGGEFEKIHGTQDPQINDGSIITETTLAPDDGLVLLKTFSSLDDVLYTNGAFARFFRPDGSRVRNGFFVFDDQYSGGTQIIRTDMNNDGKKELLVASGNKITAWRDDGQLYMRKYPYSVLYQGEIRIAVGDITNSKEKEIIVAPGPGYSAPIKVYSRHGVKQRLNWYPFGKDYTGGFSLAVGNVVNLHAGEIILGTGEGVLPQVSVFNDSFQLQRQWQPYNRAFGGGVNVAAGNLDGQGYDEIIVGPGALRKPEISIFDPDGNSLHVPFLAYDAFNTPGIEVAAVDVDFDGKDDIVGLSSGI